MEEPQQNMSRPVSRSSTSSATENDELVKRLEVQGQRKKELGLLIGQLHSMMDDEPVEQLKHKLKEMGIVQSENERLRGEISGYEDKVLQIETDAAQQVQSVLDTNEKLQKELVKLSRDLSSVESELSDQKRFSGLTSRSKGRQGGAQRIRDESSKQENKTNTSIQLSKNNEAFQIRSE